MGRVKRARVRQVPSGTPGVHFDVGAPAPRSLPPAEMKVTYVEPAEDDPDADAAVVAWLARLLRRP